MYMHHQHRQIRFVPTTLLGRIVSALVTLALIVSGFFFLIAALIGGAIVATVVLARIWWISRKLRARRDDGVIEGTYTVESEVTPRISGRREE